MCDVSYSFKLYIGKLDIYRYTDLCTYIMSYTYICANTRIYNIPMRVHTYNLTVYERLAYIYFLT